MKLLPLAFFAAATQAELVNLKVDSDHLGDKYLGTVKTGNGPLLLRLGALPELFDYNSHKRLTLNGTGSVQHLGEDGKHLVLGNDVHPRSFEFDHQGNLQFEKPLWACESTEGTSNLTKQEVVAIGEKQPSSECHHIKIRKEAVATLQPSSKLLIPTPTEPPSISWNISSPTEPLHSSAPTPFFSAPISTKHAASTTPLTSKHSIPDFPSITHGPLTSKTRGQAASVPLPSLFSVAGSAISSVVNDTSPILSAFEGVAARNVAGLMGGLVGFVALLM